MKVFQVGGCVRDRLLGLEPKDVDYVVTGATEAEMLEQGFSKVGADFPVFLHPVTKEEWALARKERKVAVGYNGFDVIFDPSVTLEEDLSRRDLTINAMALDLETNEVIDPFGGRADLQSKLLRHVSDAFAEDPIRVLRTARFAARYNFHVHPDTMELMKKVAFELNHVPHERIWAEFEKGLMEQTPVRMFQVLYDCGALSVSALSMYAGVDEDMLKVVKPETPLRVRFGAVASVFEKRHYEMCRIPADCARVAAAFNEVVDTLIEYHRMAPKVRLGMLIRLRAFNNTDLVDDVLAVWKLVHSKGIDVYKTVNAVLADLQRAKSVDVDVIVASCSNGKQVGEALLKARCEAMEG